MFDKGMDRVPHNVPTALKPPRMEAIEGGGFPRFEGFQNQKAFIWGWFFAESGVECIVNGREKEIGSVGTGVSKEVRSEE